ncbi:hypothetical protein [Metapseudomonas otitidis]|uniref:hypothetical protein n=1 Tax=Metapseudomonas otitidis TaxID=319939 RepID=UPI00244ABC2B|nr:hypothetical protein [Pseudomonas otitidis]MDH0334538.1 hypothetical protein [Pseudomonas otitidis]
MGEPNPLNVLFSAVAVLFLAIIMAGYARGEPFPGPFPAACCGAEAAPSAGSVSRLPTLAAPGV